MPIRSAVLAMVRGGYRQVANILVSPMERYIKLAHRLHILSARTIMNFSVQTAVALDAQQNRLALF
jgi:hypothetical protein